MTRICFVGNEIFPTTTGGAGFLVYRLTQALLAEGHEVVLLLNVSRAAFEQFTGKDRIQFGGGERLRAYHVDELCSGMKVKESDFLSRYTWESYRYDHAGRQVYELEGLDLIEFVDYCGPAYYALNAKLSGLSYQKASLVVRLHGPLELIDQSTPYKALDFDRYTAYSLERACFRLAEAVLYPTPSFLDAYYDRIAEPWFGEVVLAPPPEGHFPARKGEAAGANIVLFYGRLFSVKGPDRFVEAALNLLVQQPDLNVQFYLVGYDSHEPPLSGLRSYQEYLEGKIPPGLRSQFSFTGHLSHAQVAELLPQVLMAVVPSYFESFGYTAHEMRQAGAPLILSDLPAFRDEFEDETEALFFDGTASDLARQMARLAGDPVLRSRLIQSPDRRNPEPLEFYRRGEWKGWIKTADRGQQSSALICVLAERSDGEAVQRTLASLGAGQPGWQILVLQAGETAQNGEALTWFLGSPTTLMTPDGSVLMASQVNSREALLILHAGDEVDADFLERSLALLARQTEVGYVCCWKMIRSEKGVWLQTHPFPAMSELAPFEAASPFHRFVMRTRPGVPLAEIFDGRLDQLSEIDLLWRLEDSPACGVQIPKAGLWQEAKTPLKPGGSSLAYLLLNRLSPLRAARLGRYLGMLAASYPLSYLPLQAAWAQKSGLDAGGPQSQTILVQTGWRRRLYLRLSRGGKFSQALLVVMMRVWGWWQS